MLRALTSAYAPRILFPLAVLLGYSLLPLGLTLAGFTHSHFLKLATLAAIAAVALWLAMIILPIALGAAVIAWAIYRYQVWRAGGSVRGMASGGNVWRP